MWAKFVGKHDHTIFNVSLFLTRVLCICLRLPKLAKAGKSSDLSFLDAILSWLHVLCPCSSR